MSVFAKPKFDPRPPGYVPGLGRGAAGFITRYDIGPAKQQQLQQQSQAAAPEEQREEEYLDSKFDSWNGYSAPLFSQSAYDEEDKEADQVYSQVDGYIDGRRRSRREQKFKETLQALQKSQQGVGQQFKALKGGLAEVQLHEWMAIPEIGDYTVKKHKRDRLSAAPDALLLGQNQMGRQVVDGSSSVLGGSLNEVGLARSSLLSLQLEKQAESSGYVQKSGRVDSQGYLTSLESHSVVQAGVDIQDFKKARLLLKSVVQTDPKNSQAWIGYARLEELEGQLSEARQVLQKALHNTEGIHQEDIYLELARLETHHNSKTILAQALQALPRSVKLWLAAVKKEGSPEGKQQVLLQALQQVPNSAKMWQELVNLQTDDSAATKYLYEAVQCVPHSLPLWLALARLEEYQQARVVLNKARQALPQEPAIWIHAAQLEETAYRKEHPIPPPTEEGLWDLSQEEQEQGEEARLLIGRVIEKGLRILQKNKVKMLRDNWLDEAVTCEQTGTPWTCCSIVSNCLAMGVQPEDQQRVWMEDYQRLVHRQAILSARAVLLRLLHCHPLLQHFQSALLFEKKHGQNREYMSILKKALKQHPSAEGLWLTAAKHAQAEGQQKVAQHYLEEALRQNPASPVLFLAIAKYHLSRQEYPSARLVLAQARESCQSSFKVHKYSLLLEIQLDDLEAVWLQHQQLLSLFLKEEKAYILACRVQQQLNPSHDQDALRSLLQSGLAQSQPNARLWLFYIDFEVQHGQFTKARSLIEKAKFVMPSDWRLMLRSIQVELAQENLVAAKTLLSSALQQNNTSPIFWVLAIELEAKSTRKAKIVEAMKHCENSPDIILAVARLFWKDRKQEKAKKWIERALSLDSRNGDAWVHYYLFTQKELNGQPAYLQEITHRMLQEEVHTGHHWTTISKHSLALQQDVMAIMQEVLSIVRAKLQA